MRRLRSLRWLVPAVLVAFVAAAVWFRVVDSDPAVWHVDPAVTERTGRDNDVLVAPAGGAAAPVDIITEARPVPATDLLFQFNAIAGNADRTEVVAGSVEEGMITYVQRSAVFGFPDYVTVKAVETEGGAALIIWSRSRYGYSDMGVNRKRVEGWLAQIGS